MARSLGLLTAKNETKQLIDGAGAVLAGDHLRLRLHPAASGMEARCHPIPPGVLVLRSLRRQGGLLLVFRWKDFDVAADDGHCLERCETNIPEL